MEHAELAAWLRLLLTEDADEAWHVVVGTSHEVTAAKVYPLELGEPLGEFCLDMLEGALEDVGA